MQARTASGQVLITTRLPITYAISYSDEQARSLGGSTTALHLAFWNASTQQWSEASSQVDAQTRVVSATSSDLGLVALIAPVPTATEHYLYLPLVRRK